MADELAIARLLDDLLEGRANAYSVDGEVRALAMLARSCQQLVLPGLEAEQEVRLRQRFDRFVEVRRPGRLPGWLSWPVGGPLAQRLAAAAVVVTALGGGASYATGVTPVEAITGVVDFGRSVVRNIDPRMNAGGSIDGTATPSDAATPAPTVSPSETPDPVATPAPTQMPGAGTLVPGKTESATGTSNPATTTTPNASPTEDDDEVETPTGGSTTPDDSGNSGPGNSSDDDEIEVEDES